MLHAVWRVKSRLLCLLQCCLWSILKGLATRQQKLESFHWYRKSSNLCCKLGNACHVFVQVLWSGLKVFLEKGSIPGGRYLVKPNYHFTERIFWIMAMVLSFWWSLYIMQTYLHLYQDDVFRLVIKDEPSPLGMDFPAIALCELPNQNYSTKLDLYVDDFYSRHKHLNYSREFVDFLRALTYPSSHSSLAISNFYEMQQSLPLSESLIYRSVNYNAIAQQLRMSCDEFFYRCNAMDEEFPCCEYFSLLNTMQGKCFAINSLQTKSDRYLKLPSFNRIGKRTSMNITFKTPAQIFLFDKKYVPVNAIRTPKIFSHYPSNTDFLGFRTFASVSDAGISNLKIESSKCLTEKKLGESAIENQTCKYYTYGSCLTDCVRQLQLEKCGCISYYLNKENASFCDLQGYLCLEKFDLINTSSLVKLRYPPCLSCLPSCETYFVLLTNFERYPLSYLGTRLHGIYVYMRSVYQHHLHRQITRSKTDIVVSLGGILSLFTGCNLINLAEIVFIICCAFCNALKRTRIRHS